MTRIRPIAALRWSVVWLFVLSGCRADRMATATDVVLQFYTMRDAVGGTGAPSAKELAALRPFITDTLALTLAMADSLRRADIVRAPDEKPRFAEGDLYSSMFEGATTYRVLPAGSDGNLVRVHVEFTNDRQRPTVRWTDTVVVVQHAGRWLVEDIRYGATWDFSNKGSLRRALVAVP